VLDAGSGGALSLALAGVVEAWLSFADSMMTVLVLVEVRPALNQQSSSSRAAASASEMPPLTRLWNFTSSSVVLSRAVRP
jgi:hypothetical protein